MSARLAGRIDGAILDLDYTLFSPRTIPRSAFAPLLDAVRRANVGADAVSAARLEAASEAAWEAPFDDVARRYGLPPRLTEAWHRAGCELRFDCVLEPYPDVGVLGTLGLPLVLVTTGFDVPQRSKVEALGLASLFRGIYVDALDDPARRPGKAAVFRAILAEYGWAPERVMVIGDNAESEIAAGIALGMITVQIVRPGIVPCETATHRIASFEELPALVAASGTTRSADDRSP